MQQFNDLLTIKKISPTGLFKNHKGPQVFRTILTRVLERLEPFNINLGISHELPGTRGSAEMWVAADLCGFQLGRVSPSHRVGDLLQDQSHSVRILL